MNRSAISCLALMLALSTAVVVADQTESDVSLPAAAGRHFGEIDAKRANMERALTFYQPDPKNWAPIPDPSPIDVIHYELDLALDLGRRVMSGTAVVDVAAAADGLSVVELDVDLGLRVLAVMQLADEAYPSDSPRSLAFEHADDVLSVALPQPLAAGERVRLMIPYGGHANRFGDGINWSSHSGGSPAIFTFAEPFGARVWFPSNDRPDDKATVNLTVTAPATLTVAANGLEVERMDNGDGTATTRWESQYQVATYLVVMNLSDYAYREWTYDAMDGGTMPVVAYMYPEIADAGEIDLAITPEMIAVLASRFDEYPFVEEKYGNLTANFGGGMEHQTLTTIGNFFGDPWMEWLNVHELGHQWWGDWVTCDDWRELWLNESFATYAEFVWAEEYHGDDFLIQYAEDADWAQFFNGALYDNPVAFSRTVYDKGALVLRMLRLVMGDDAFFEGMRSYRNAYAENSATTEELLAVMEDAAGEDLRWFFDQWVYGKNRPRIQYDWEVVTGPAVRLTITQEHSNAPYFRTPMDVKVFTNSGFDTHRVMIEAEAEQTVEIPVSDTPTAVTMDPDHVVLAHLSHANQPDLDFGPDFPDLVAEMVHSGNTSTVTVPLTNTGGSTLVIEGAAMNGSSPFRVVSPTDYPVSLESGESVDMVVEFRSSSSGNQQEYGAVFSNDPSYPGGYAYFTVAGRSAAFEDPRLVATSQINVPSVPVGGVGETSFSVRNYGAEPLTLSTQLGAGPFRLASVVPSTVDGGGSVGIFVRFEPSDVGQHSTTLTLFSNDPNNPEHVVTVTGSSFGAPRLQINPAPINLGMAADGGQATVTIANTGTEDLELAGLSLDGDFDFVGEVPSLPAALGSMASVNLQIASSAQGTGDVRGSFRVDSNDPSLPRTVIPVSAYGLADGQTLSNWSYPAAASTVGLGGALWISQAFLLNPTDEEMMVSLGFRPKTVRSDSDLTLSLPARSQRSVEDLVRATGHRGAGGVAIGVAGEGFVGVSRTFSAENSGTFGQYIPAIPITAAMTEETLWVLPGLAGNDGFHTNMGAYNFSDVGVDITYELFTGDGTSLGSGTLMVEAGAYQQHNEVIAELTSDRVRGGYALLSTVSPDARFAAYGSVVDDGSHDPTLVLPVSVDGSNETLVIPVVASNPGVGQTMWRTDVALVNLSDVMTEVTVTLHSHGADSSEAFTVLEQSAYLLEDVVREAFGGTGSGWLEIEASGPGLAANSRTYNDAAEGTYGQFVPAVTGDALISDGEIAVLAGLNSDGFRTNLGLTSLSDSDITVTATVFDDRGETLGELQIEVLAGAFVQMQRLLGQQIGYTGTAWATLTSDDPEASYLAHISVVDEVSGDPIYIPAVVR